MHGVRDSRRGGGLGVVVRLRQLRAEGGQASPEWLGVGAGRLARVRRDGSGGRRPAGHRSGAHARSAARVRGRPGGGVRRPADGTGPRVRTRAGRNRLPARARSPVRAGNALAADRLPRVPRGGMCAGPLLGRRRGDATPGSRSRSSRHVVDCREPAAPVPAAARCDGERAGNLYIQYWAYYPDSRTVPFGEAGYHPDDWESFQVRIGPDVDPGARELAPRLQRPRRRPGQRHRAAAGQGGLGRARRAAIGSRAAATRAGSAPRTRSPVSPSRGR